MSNENEIILFTPISFKRIKIDSLLIEKFKEHEKFLLNIFGWKQTLKEKYGLST